MITKPSESFLINARFIPVFNQLDFYANYYKNVRFEFIINENLELLECTKLSIAHKQNNYNYIENNIKNFNEIYNILFELNHVRVNPKLDNHTILTKLSNTLVNLGIKIDNSAKHNSLDICFQPLGKIKDKVRFYIKKNNQINFVSKQLQLKF